MPSVSVIIPAYNAAKTIEKCLGSVLGQTLDDLEVIVVDDGSSDDTLEVAGRMADGDDRVKVLSQENSHAGVARNRGMAQATGDYLYFLDADDWIDTVALEAMVGAARDAGADVVLCHSRSVDNNTGDNEPIAFAIRGLDSDRIYRFGDLDADLFQCCVGWPWDKLFDAAFVRDNGLEFQSLRTSNDALFVFSAMALAGSVYVLGGTLVNHRIHDASSLENTRTKSWDNAFLAAETIEKEFKDKGIFEQYEQSYLQWLVHFSLWNYFSLPDADKPKILERIKDVVVPRVSALDLDKVDDTEVKTAAKVLDRLASGADPLGAAFWLCHEYAHVVGEAADFMARTGELEGEVVRLRHSVDELRSTKDRDLEALRQEMLATVRERESERDAFVNSLSFKVGRAITQVPRSVRDRLQGK
ncbi:glycosyltransferase family 2 protein [Olsenella sp. CU969]|uniref:glycosyltransferase family 2 protein n=1 Tax=Olsenella sp. CU969 TaxID=2780101 RepID=UPI00195CCCA6|nr:glycosyltransferase family 2 protein [Olsenella sp. CU969]MBF0599438.1 glycosyltransferase [Atopobiaceae bacterium FL090493]